MTCSAPRDCEEIERRHTNGAGLLVDGGTSRGNLLSGGAEEVILTVSRIKAERKANPGLPGVLRERTQRHAGAGALRGGGRARALGRGAPATARCAAARTPRRNVSVPARGDVRRRPRPDRVLGHLGHASRPSRRLRDALELRRGRAPLGSRAPRHARSAPQARQAARPDRTRAVATPRARTRSSSSPTTGRRRARRSGSATGTGWTTSFATRSRHGRCRRCSEATRTRPRSGSRSRRHGTPSAAPSDERGEAEARRAGRRRARVRQPRPHLPDGGAASPDARGDRGPTSATRHRSSRASPRRFRPRPLRRAWARRARGSGRSVSRRGSRAGRRPSRRLSRRTLPQHLARSDGFEHAPDLFVNSFYDPQLDEGCAFEELISFHGGMGGSQTRPFILAPGRAAASAGADRRRGAGARDPDRLESAPEPRARRRRLDTAGHKVLG